MPIAPSGTRHEKNRWTRAAKQELQVDTLTTWRLYLMHVNTKRGTAVGALLVHEIVDRV